MSILSDKDRLIEEIHALPSSVVKDLLSERVTEYFTQTPPFSIQRGGLRFSVPYTGIEINTEAGSDVQGGKYQSRKEGVLTSGFRVDQRTTVTVPLSNFVSEKERKKYPAKDFSKDGSFLPSITFAASQEFKVGLAPHITVYSPDRTQNKIPADFIEIGEKFTFIKEACGLLIDDLRLDDMYKRSTALGLLTTIRAQDGMGLISSVEGLTAVLSSLNGNDGRFIAMQDLTAYFLAIKAFEGVNVAPFLRFARSISQVLNSIHNTKLRGNAESVLKVSSEWVLTNKDARQLPHMGNLNKIP